MDDILDELARIMNEGPMRTFIVKTEELEAESERLSRETGLRLASVSNTGLPPEYRRLTFLPHDAFNEPDPNFRPSCTVAARGEPLKKYTCVQGHDLCSTSYPGPECPYCEVRTKQPGDPEEDFF